MPGMLVGPWRVTDGEPHRGQDRVGVTYGVVNTFTGVPAALELINAPPLGFGSYTDRLQQVMRDLQRIAHPGVLAVFDVGTMPDGRPYVVRELLDGVTLDRILAQGELKQDVAIGILVQICDVLVAAHAAGVTHRALQPAHVLAELDRRPPQVKLLDWGIMEVIADEASRSFKLGAIGAGRAAPDPKDDVHALAVMAHQLVKPIPPALEELWVEMLAEHPSLRPSIDEVAYRLAMVANALSPRAAPPRQLQPESFEPESSDAFERSFESETPEPEPFAVHAIPVPVLKPGLLTRWRWPLVTTIAAAALLLAVGLRDRSTVQRMVDETPEVAIAPTTESGEVATPSTGPAPAIAQRAEPKVAVAASSAEPAAQPVPAEPAAAVPPAPAASLPRELATPAPQEPAIAPSAPAAPAVVTTARKPAIVRTPPARKLAAKPRAEADEASADNALLRQYQRVGHQLILLQKQQDPAAEGLWTRFRSIRIQAAMATTSSRQETAAILVDLEDAIARSKK
jgi:serine/threonine-protein kinase